VRLYLDTSALVKLYIEEEGSAQVRAGVDRAVTVATAHIAFVEIRSALSRKHGSGEVTAGVYHAARTSLEDDWPCFMAVGVTEAVIREAARLVDKHRLRAYDAIHLASAIQFSHQTGEEGDVLFAAWDDNLANAAKREGFQLLTR
jgi:predicted nucleic acid-binding protein